MNEALRHRGPDEGSVDAFGRCVLGHRRLRVIDLETGSQPVGSESGKIVCVFNGELYNFRELRAELTAKGHAVPGSGDTALLPHLYEEHGLGFAERLSGMFAIALWDSRRERLILARDRLGKKPLLWTRLPDGTIAFASELKALLRLPSLRREVDGHALDAYLALQYVPGPATALRGVAKVPPGHLLVVEQGRERLERYWRPSPRPRALTEEAWLELVRDGVSAAVRRRLVSDVPLGALLSGGIDSSIVVALMARAAAGAVRTFSVGFADGRYDERPYARAVAARYGTDHEELVLEPDLDRALPRLAASLDEPLGDEAALPLFLICEAARRHVTVALTGDGGDEAFAGYERYRAYALGRRLGAVPGLAAAARGLRLLSREPRSHPVRAARFLEAAAAPTGERYARLTEVFPPRLRAELWNPDFVRPAEGPLVVPRGEGVVDLQLLDLETYLPDDLLLKADLTSMASSLELRSPFLDHEVVELGLSLPDSLRWRGTTGKIALRRAFAAELPPEIARRGKRGFGVPLSRWFRVELRELAHDVLLDARARGRGQLRPVAVEHLLHEHANGVADHGHRLWCLLMLELWQRSFLDGEPHGSPAPARLDRAQA